MQSPMRLILAGGGDERDSRPLDELFASWVGGKRLLYLPTALVRPSNLAAAERWLRGVFNPLGVADIEVWTHLPGKTARDLAAFDAVYIGGGNTFFLLHQLRLHKLDLALIDFVEEGKVVYGGSAGAIILGYDLESCAHIDENIIGLEDWAGLDLALGLTVWCHYTGEEDQGILAYVARTGVPSLALRERSGAYRLGDRLFAAGYEPAVLFTPQGRMEIAVGEEIEVGE